MGIGLAFTAPNIAIAFAERDFSFLSEVNFSFGLMYLKKIILTTYLTGNF